MDSSFRKLILYASLLILIIIILYGIIEQHWYLLALPIGFFFGFFLQKGDLCFASAVSELVMFRDRSKLFGFWVAIISSMISFSVITSLGWVTLNPKHFMWLSAIIGGLIFGSGMVFAGGCISGCLYKGATGNINSIMAILAIPIGIALVEFGPLSETSKYLNSFVIKGDGGTALSLFYITGIPYWILSVLFALATILFVLFKKSRKQISKQENKSDKNILFRSWKPWAAGIAIGILGASAYLTSATTGRNYPLGITHGVLQAHLILTEKNSNLEYIFSKNIQPKKEPKAETTNNQTMPKVETKKINVWLVLNVIGLVIGAFISGYSSGKAKFLPKEPSQTFIALLGGLMIGIGAALTGGCSIGNILSGWSLMSLGNFVFGIFAILGAYITTIFYLIGIKNQ